MSKAQDNTRMGLIPLDKTKQKARIGQPLKKNFITKKLYIYIYINLIKNSHFKKGKKNYFDFFENFTLFSLKIFILKKEL